jgi:hypothetical protein
MIGVASGGYAQRILTVLQKIGVFVLNHSKNQWLTNNTK